MNDKDYMKLAIIEAESAFALDEVPVGAVIVSENNEILAQSHNIKEKTQNPCGHAEILALMKATKRENSWRLNGATLYVTLEPCIMCMGAISHARLKRVVFGAYDHKGGALSLGYNINKDSRLNHSFSVVGGVEHYRCSKLLSKFFREKRKNYKNIVN